MLSDLEIVNKALGRLGVERIVSLEDNNKRAKLAKDFLESAKKITLEFTPWDFALKRETLSSTGTPAFEFQYQFDLPSDYLKMVSEYNGSEYFVEGPYLLSNTETLLIKYIFEIDETVKRTPNFDKAWYVVLASEMAYSLTQNAALQGSLFAEAEMIASRASSLNAMASSPISYEIDTFTDSRL